MEVAGEDEARKKGGGGCGGVERMARKERAGHTAPTTPPLLRARLLIPRGAISRSISIQRISCRTAPAPSRRRRRGRTAATETPLAIIKRTVPTRWIVGWWHFGILLNRNMGNS